LQAHAERCTTICQYLDEEFKKVYKNLSKRPENIEQLVELEEYMAGLNLTLSSLQSCISDMMSYHTVLDKFKYRSDYELGMSLWSIYGAPSKIAVKCIEAQENNVTIKRRYHDDMITEQSLFSKSLHELHSQVASLSELTDLKEVISIAESVKEVEIKLIAAQNKVKLFNSREALFEQDITDYEELNKILKNFEPYSNLWQTAKEWTELSASWKNSKFIELNSEEVEKSVDKFNIAINKAAKYFQKSDMKLQNIITNKIKMQITEFIPEVPMIVTLRNPGMRDRHWEKIAEQLNVNILPIENFTTSQIIALNLKDSLDLIQKIGESAAKEYQIENALDKMEREWENMILQIHPYRETGTGVLKGVDDINVVLDEQITMTQVRLLSYNII
jgi:dynein heavy chain